MILKTVSEIINENLALNSILGIVDIVLLIMVVLLAFMLINSKTIASKEKEPVDLGAAIHIGARQYQQDAYYIPSGVSKEVRVKKGTLCVLCDGMGGLAGGDKASTLCVDAMTKDFYDLEKIMPIETFFSSEVEELDQKVCGLVDEGGRPVRAGTTLVCALVKDGMLSWCAVGDSRIYIIRDGKAEQLTRDHNYALKLADLVELGHISVEDAMTHPERESLISFIGMDGVRIIDINTDVGIKKNDIVLLCSDGLYGSLRKEEMAVIAEEHRHDMALAAHVMIATAFDKGYSHQDNMSVVLLKYNGKSKNEDR